MLYIVTLVSVSYATVSRVHEGVAWLMLWQGQPGSVGEGTIARRWEIKESVATMAKTIEIATHTRY